MKKFIAVLTLVLFVSGVGLAMAQDANGNNPKMSPKNRLERQKGRIEMGKANGKISKKESRQLARSGKRINKQRKADLAKDGGKLDKQDRKHLEKEENKRSDTIYNDKHN